jgi:beta-phosphoglucomutase-like phosphatase (HAD superfamily)
VIVETEELHRLAYNGAFAEMKCTVNGKQVEWVPKYYDVLQNTVGGGKPKMKWSFGNEGWPDSTLGPAPTSEEEQTRLVDQLQDAKTVIYKKIVVEVATARPGVLEMMDDVLKREDLAAGICSAATKGGFDQVVNSVVGKDRLGNFDVVMAGDDVPRKKPDPIIYQLASEKIGVPPERCVVVEDSLVGLRAAKGAGMKCIITYTDSTADQDFYGEGADAVVPDLGKISLDDIFAPLLAGEGTLLDGIKEAPRVAK